MKNLAYSILLIFLAQSSFSQTLNDYLQEALENNPEVQASYLEFEAALISVSRENSLPDPTVSIGYFISPIETRVGAQQAKISITQMFPWFGTLRQKEDRAGS